MARILSVTAGVKSHLYSHLALAHRLRAGGHEPAIASPDASVGTDVEAAGIRFVRLAPERGRWHPAPYLPGFRGWLDGGRYATERRETLLSGAGLPQALTAFDPDLVIVDTELHEHIVIALCSGRATATIEFHLSPRQRRGVPRLSHFLVPDDSLAARLRAALHWRRTRAQRAAGRLLRRVANRGADKHSTLHALARQCGRDFGALADTRGWQVYTFPGLPCLRATVPDMDFRPARPAPNEYFIGPLILDSEFRNYDAAVERAVESFIDAQPAGRPLVLLSFGSILNSPEHIRAAIDAVTDRPVTLLVSAGGDADRLRSAGLPPNVFVTRWLPLKALLPRARLMITHGGVATIHESIAAGVPLLVYSMGVMDMHGNAARVHGKALGIAGEPGELASRMWHNIETLLNEDRYRVNCKAMAETFARYASRERVLDAIENCRRGGDIAAGPAGSD